MIELADVLMALCGASLAVGGWFFRELRFAVRDLTHTVADLRTEIAVLRVNQDKIADHETRIRALETACKEI